MATRVSLETIEDFLPDSRWDDPFYRHPSAPRWVFFDDPPPGPEERKARREAIEREEHAAKFRPYPAFKPDLDACEIKTRRPTGKPLRRKTCDGSWVVEGRFQDDEFCYDYIPQRIQYVDPRVDKYHQRIEERRLELWKDAYRRRNLPDEREDLLMKWLSKENHPSSIVQRLKDGLFQHTDLPRYKCEILATKLAPSSALRRIFERPTLDHRRTPVTKIVRFAIPEIKWRMVYGNGWPYPKSEIITRHRSYKQRSIVESFPNREQYEQWKVIHQALKGKGDSLLLRRYPEATLFLNPDGSIYLNRTEATRHAIPAKKKFAKIHKVPESAVLCERINTEWDKEYVKKLRQRNPTLPIRLPANMFVVSLRTPSNEKASSYYDPNPDWVERITKVVTEQDGKKVESYEWVREYQWSSGMLHRIPKDHCIPDDNYGRFDDDLPMLPEGSHILSIRDFERALLAGAIFADDDIDANAMAYENLDDLADDRLKSDDHEPRKPLQSLSEDLQKLHKLLVSSEQFDLAELLLLREQGHISNELATLPDVAATIRSHFLNNQDDLIVLYETLSGYREFSGWEFILLDLLDIRGMSESLVSSDNYRF